MDGKAFKDTLKNFGSYEEKKQFSKEDKKPDDGWTDEQDKAETKLLEDIFEGKKPEKSEEPKYSHFGDYDILGYDDFVNDNEGLASAINARGDKATKDVLLGFFKKPNNLSSYEKDGKVYLQQDDDNLSDVLEISPEDLSAIEEAASKRAEKPAEEKPKSYAGMSDEELDKSVTKLLEDIFDGKKPDSETVASATVKAAKTPRVSKKYINTMIEDLQDTVALDELKKNIESGMAPADAFAKAINDSSMDYWTFDASVDNGNVVLKPNGLGGDGTFRHKVLDSDSVAQIVSAVLKGNEPAEDSSVLSDKNAKKEC